jgi:hypothetical protein
VLYTTGAVATDGVQALFVEGGSSLAKASDMDRLSTKVAEMMSGNKHTVRRQ